VKMTIVGGKMMYAKSPMEKAYEKVFSPTGSDEYG